MKLESSVLFWLLPYHGEEGGDVLGQVDVQQEVVLHLVEELEALPVAGVVKALHHLPQLGLQLQEQLKKAVSASSVKSGIRIHFIPRWNSWT
jgi:hypothetical protein